MSRNDARGFTLIELMIVVAIIAIIVAIAVPSLLRARMAANESSAVGSCKAFGTAQEMYRRTDWDGDGYLEYAKNIGQHGGRGNGESLYFNNAANVPIGLVDVGMNNAEGDPNAGYIIPKGGYCFDMQMSMSWPRVRQFLDNNTHLMGGYAISAVPHAYNATGINSFQLAGDGVIYQSDTGNNNHQAVYNVDPAANWVATE